ncbi:MAG: hypothetical protein HYW24_04060 [Candidatus Aenigmarchaeota archaeon]|nr:hypothetical protein [Candidatus Aenigmarchaeota archaeon]
MKGISPLIATVLLIAFTVGIGGLISVWSSGFTQTTTGIVGKEGENAVICSNGALDVSDLKYCNNNVSGIIKNNGRIALGNITLQVTFTNASLVSLALNDSSGVYLALKPGQIGTFNVSIGGASSGNYNKLYLYTNCSTVNDKAQASDVAAC